MIGLFDGAREFNQDLSTWMTSRVTSLGTAFRGATKFLGNGLSDWDVGRVTSFGSCFHSATSFNGNISSWDVSRSTYFNHMFIRASSFQQDLSAWDVSSGTDFKAMFHSARLFNPDISRWNVGNGLYFSYMFEDNVAFNVDISSWDVSKAIEMRGMFEKASSFQVDLCAWAPKLLGRSVRFEDMFTGSGCPSQTYPMSTTTAVGPLCYYCSDMPCDDDRSDSECQCFSPDGSLQRAVADYIRDSSQFSAVAHTYGSIIGDWCTHNVTSFDFLFDRAVKFNEDISKWTTSKVTSMVSIYYHCVVKRSPLV
jgi:surface protein